MQGVAGQLLTFWGELGFAVPPFPFIAHTRGWDAEDMERNVRQVKASEALRTASAELVERALDFWKILDQHRGEIEKPMERSGRKAQRLAAAPEETSMTDRLGDREGLREGALRGAHGGRRPRSSPTTSSTGWPATPPIGGEWHGRDAVLRAFAKREFGLGAADWGYEEVWRDWYEADERVIVEIRERSWLRSAPEDRARPAHVRRDPLPRRSHLRDARLQRRAPLRGVPPPPSRAAEVRSLGIVEEEAAGDRSLLRRKNRVMRLRRDRSPAAGTQRLDCIQRSMRARSTGSVWPPPARTASWKARRSKRAPSRCSASARSARISS